MVVTRKTHSRYQAAIDLIARLALALIAALITTGCSPQTDRTVVQLHFKTGEQVEELLTHLLSDDIKYKVIDNSVIFDAPQKDIKPALSVIEKLDQPPVSYKLILKDKNIRSYSTNNEPSSLFLVEGKTTTTKFNNLTLRITLNKANNQQSLMHTLSRDQKGNINENHWLLPHNQNSNPDPRLFPKGIVLQIQ